jgi:glycosyltransferase involved in cell wall biosynthesis
MIALPNFFFNAYILPAGMVWPIMTHIKQKRAFGDRILFQRTDPPSIGREESTWTNLLNGESVIWIGLPGIGKSLAVMPLLMKCLKTLVTKNDKNISTNSSKSRSGFHSVVYRLSEQLIEFQRDDVGIQVYLHNAGDTLHSACNRYNVLYSNFKNNGLTSLLLLELEEGEEDPRFKGPGLISTSSRYVEEKTCKTLYKASAKFYLMDPPSTSTLNGEYDVLRYVYGESGLPLHINTKDKFVDLLDTVGPIPRILFNSYLENVNKFLGQRKNKVTQALLEIADSKVSISNVGEALQYFMAPYNRPGVKIPLIGATYSDQIDDDDDDDESNQSWADSSDEIYEFRALSEGCKVLLASKVTSPYDLTFWKYSGRLHELLEATCKYGRCGKVESLTNAVKRFVEPEKSVSNWLFYEDVGSAILWNESQLAEVPDYLKTTWINTECFDGSYLRSNVVYLKEGILYLSIAYNLAVGEYFMVDHKKKRVIMDQATVSRLKEHGFNIDTIDEVLESLQMLEGEGKNYKLVIIGISDMSLSNPTGMIFNRKIGKKIVASKSLVEWQSMLASKEEGYWANADRVETYIARVKVFDASSFVLASKIDPSKVRQFSLFFHFALLSSL